MIHVTQLHMIMEFFEGQSLKEILKTKGHLDEATGKKVVRQLAEALEYCHSRGIAHLDVKSENVLLDDSCTLKLIDFAFAMKLEAGKKTAKFCGSISYMAPEVARKIAYEPIKADVWSFGITVHKLLTGKHPGRGSLH